MNHSKIIKNTRLKSLYLQITLLLATVTLTLIVKETSHRVSGFIFKKKLTSKPNQILNDLQGSGNCEHKAIL